MVGKIFFALLAVVFSISLVSPREQSDAEPAYAPAWGIFAAAGLGWANNIYIEDTQNELVDGWDKLGYKEDEGSSGYALIYRSLGIDLRVFSGNMVYSFPVSYYKVSGSRRVVPNGENIWESRINMEFWSISFIANYKIVTDSNSYFLLGGGGGIYRGSVTWDLITNGNVDRDHDVKWTVGVQTGLEYHLIFGRTDLFLGVGNRFAEVYHFRVRESYSPDSNMTGGLTGIYFSAGAGYLL